MLLKLTYVFITFMTIVTIANIRLERRPLIALLNLSSIGLVTDFIIAVVN